MIPFFPEREWIYGTYEVLVILGSVSAREPIYSGSDRWVDAYSRHCRSLAVVDFKKGIIIENNLLK